MICRWMLLQNFLSDLCGREVACSCKDSDGNFLSDLCGREVNRSNYSKFENFLSDLCGREG